MLLTARELAVSPHRPSHSGFVVGALAHTVVFVRQRELCFAYLLYTIVGDLGNVRLEKRKVHSGKQMRRRRPGGGVLLSAAGGPGFKPQ